MDTDFRQRFIVFSQNPVRDHNSRNNIIRTPYDQCETVGVDLFLNKRGEFFCCQVIEGMAMSGKYGLMLSMLLCCGTGFLNAFLGAYKMMIMRDDHMHNYRQTGDEERDCSY